MKNYWGIFKLLETSLFFLIIGINSECEKSNNNTTVSPGNSDTLAPTVNFTDPANGGTAIPISETVLATFTEDLDSSTLNTTTFTLSQGTAQVPGMVSYANGVAIFSPTSNLSPNTAYTAEITQGVKDQSGNAMTTPKVWTFTTGSVHDTTTPRVIYTFPGMSDTGVALNISPMATFSEEMDSMTFISNAFTLKQGAQQIPGRVVFNDEAAIFMPATNLSPHTIYTVEVSVNAEDKAGNPMAESVVWTFTTGSVRDTTIPQVTYTFPRQSDTGVALNINPAATFSEMMDSASISTSTFTLKQDTVQIPGKVVFSGTTAIFTPATNLSPNSTYTVSVSANAKDIAGNSLVGVVVWTFKTGAM